MAISRSLGATSFTTWSPIRMRPFSILQPGQTAQSGGLAAARGADQDEEFLILHLDVQVVYRDHITEPLVNVVKCNACHLVFSFLRLTGI